ncbi:hypothetical protein DFH09DRAFT_1412891 [Mycena vulgaris]|nr:hypothetical protein DFH09DRAFT_1412891 [Mycena vulgaris]
MPLARSSRKLPAKEHDDTTSPTHRTRRHASPSVSTGLSSRSLPSVALPNLSDEELEVFYYLLGVSGELTYGGSPGAVDHPYHPGRTLQIYFKPELSALETQDPYSLKQFKIQSELSPNWRDGFTPLTVSIVKSFTPFTCDVVIAAEILDCPQALSLPKKIILKLNDRRFGYRDERPKLVWGPQGEARLRDGIRTILGPERSTPIQKMYYHPLPDTDPEGEGPLGVWDGWELEIYIWTLKQGIYLREALAYRHLRTLQGGAIPQLYGTVRVPLSPTTPFLHPIVDFVPGLGIEHIAGPSMSDVKVGVDVTNEMAETISRQLIDNVAAMRDAYCRHNDLALRNVVLRNWPHTPQPVIIDLGMASVIEPGASRAAWYGHVDEAHETRKTLTWPQQGGWHVASPYQQHVYERYAGNVGYAKINAEIENLPDVVRNLQFERIPGTEGLDKRDKMLQWRVRPGVRTQDNYLHQQWLQCPLDD